MITAIVQARMGSTRLPGKVMTDILGKPMLWHLINRLGNSKMIDKIVLAVPDKESDKVLLELARDMGIESFAGSETDVLDRYYQAAKKSNTDTIVRITGDCPLIDPGIVDEIINYYIENKTKFDIVHNGTSYPDGIAEIEIFSFSVLKEAWEKAGLVSEREHVTAFIWKNPGIFRSATIENREDLSHLRLVVDDEKDLRLVREIFKTLYKEGEVFHLKDIINLLNRNPHLAELNRGTIRNEGYIKSLEKDTFK